MKSPVGALADSLRAAALASLVVANWPGPANAHEYRAGALRIDQPWTRPTRASVGVGYMVIVNGGKADALVAATTPAAERVEIHQTTIDDGVMRMRPVGRLELPEGATVRLEPGGLHMMLVGLKQPFAAGAKLPLVLRFAGAGEVRVELMVTDATSAPGGSRPPAGIESH